MKIRIERWNPDALGSQARVGIAQECALGGAEGTVERRCPNEAEFIVFDKRGTPLATCPEHLVIHIRRKLARNSPLGDLQARVP